jgi:antitoxin component YwqK of YwqJK toxin-antitoxin module
VRALLALALAAALDCPPGTTPAGREPPLGLEAWCERPDAAGRQQRHGPALLWYEPGAIHKESSWRDGRLDGPYVEYFREGGRASAGRHRQGERDGTWTWWYPDGRQEEVVGYDRGRREGPFRQWWRNGNLRTEGRFCAGQQCGEWTTWSEQGDRLGTARYEEVRSRP